VGKRVSKGCAVPMKVGSYDDDSFVDPWIKDVKQRHSYELLLKAQVQSVGLGRKKASGIDTGVPCIVVYVFPKLPRSALSPRDVVPTAVEDVLTDVIEMRPPEARVRTSSPLREPERAKRWRPAPAGVSVGHYQLKGAGTLGAWIRGKTGEYLLMSCWHVLTNYGKGRRGDPILQPALADGGSVEKDTIAWLDRWTDVRMLGPNLGEAKSNLKALLDLGKTPPVNYVDVAFAKPISQEVVSNEILGLGASPISQFGQERTEIRIPQLDEDIVKSGRTTGVTRGKICAVDLNIFVGYPTGIALFLDCDAVT